MNLTTTYTFHMPIKMLYGIGVIRKVGEVARELGGTKAFLVTDQGIAGAGLLEKVMSPLEAEGLEVQVFERAAVEPNDAQIDEGARQFKGSGANLILGVGGGASMDAAKCIKVMASNPGTILDYAGLGDIEGNPIPLIAVPTTSGTGSEAGGGAVVVDPQKKNKVVIYSPHIAPTVALVDPLMTMTVPPKVTAYTGLDALAQAMGAYVANVTQPAAEALAIYAVELIYENLGRAVARGDDLEARTNMAYGSLISGLAMYSADATGEHFLAETIGGHYGLPHGLTVAMVLPYTLEYNRLAVPQKFIRLAQAMGERTEGLTVREAGRKAVEAVVKLLEDLEIPTLKEVGVREADFEELTDKTMAHLGIELRLNPREMSREDVLRLYQKAYHGDLFD